MGARRIGVTSLPPLGCLPAAITLFGHGSNACVSRLNSDAQSFNRKMNYTVDSLSRRYPDLKIAVFDIYTPLYDLATNPASQGMMTGRLVIICECHFTNSCLLGCSLAPTELCADSWRQASPRRGGDAAGRARWRRRCSSATPSPSGRARTRRRTCSGTRFTRRKRPTKCSPTRLSPRA